ncbi:hypothetical protein BCR43DRAFT_97953 [Syncephalastrum racemosum]|uniref:GDP-fucose protein O-fucosyltransferase-domain-containing protein n=1 Tax=Syncephalastrum racemosum TaxID=13706 RepID=A0A1X2H171_SYNRA|nr:hypothetical protein BCR43DRAFT_97953 [Syncephalastrum racemosum]
MIRTSKLLVAAGLATLCLVFALTRHPIIQQPLGTAPKQLWRPAQHDSTSQQQVITAKEEKFITFNPHSGLHNQRLALINALVLAKALDRTLLLPQLNLGKGVYWWPSPILSKKLSDCPGVPVTERTKLCHNEYRKYIPVPVSTVFDLDFADSTGIRTIQRQNMALDYYQTYFALGNDSDVYRVDDKDRFSYRIYENANSSEPLGKYKVKLDLDNLRNRPETFLEFNSLFGTPRLVLERDGALHRLRDWISYEMGFGHPVVLNQALAVVGQLGGPGAFVSVHLRTGDGVFRATRAATMDKVRQTLEQHNSQVRHHHSAEDMAIEEITRLAKEGEISQALHACLDIQSPEVHPRLRMVFMATDAAQPRRTMAEFFDEFACLFTLSDFPDAVAATVTTGQYDGVSSYGPLLLPLVDAEVASHGSFFEGTRRSTFSKYIQYRNRRFRSYYPTI